VKGEFQWYMFEILFYILNYILYCKSFSYNIPTLQQQLSYYSEHRSVCSSHLNSLTLKFSYCIGEHNRIVIFACRSFFIYGERENGG
jgi:hypothetical protein